MNTAFDVSDAPFQVARKAPEPEIAGARDGVELWPARRSACAAGHRRRGRHAGRPRALLDLGQRRPARHRKSLYLTGLSQGEHIITLAAVDSDGMTGTATLRVVAQ